ncbi:mammalian peroxisomal membrane protein-like protein [Gelatoporia subvermispora B]|uniref:Mammalian peroxisomal membrane protein-like protein n=1 Tax=Ceriporiopsis subvermispora (strain B) TaxID=914234 RepID=M2RV57_CERS8|nr:mammalian peroxisomal membrane protein-like protein [Gelatoporia subvermispora B]
MASFLRAFNASLVRRPMATQCITSAVLFGTGDVLAQQVGEGKGRDHDFTRTARAAFYGGALFGPALTKWLQLLNRLKFQTKTKAVMYRVYLDQLVFTPVVVCFFFGSMTFLEGYGFSEAQKRISQSYVPTVLRNWESSCPRNSSTSAWCPRTCNLSPSELCLFSGTHT